ncbi:MAG: hypothetical protein ABR534_01135 [Desulfotignum sp.]
MALINSLLFFIHGARNLPENHDPKNDALFVKNEPIKCLMIPPENREQIAPIVKQLSDLLNPKWKIGS